VENAFLASPVMAETMAALLQPQAFSQKDIGRRTLASDVEIEARFWRELRDSPVVMLGLDGVAEGRSQPMTAFFEGERAPLWFFSSSEAELARQVADEMTGRPAIASFSAKGHDLFASLHGRLSIERDAILIDRFWDDRVANWYADGRHDPKLLLLRLDADSARIWLNAWDFAAPIRRLFGRRPHEAVRSRVAEVLL